MLRDWTQSEKIDELTCESERFFTRLIMKVDDLWMFLGGYEAAESKFVPFKTG